MASDNRSHDNPSPWECGSCLTPYDEKECRPRTLPCGHTFCSACLSILIKDDHLICPNCCANHLAPNIGQFPISLALEDMIRAMQGFHFGPHFQAANRASKASQVRDTEKLKAPVWLSNKMQAMVEEQKVNMKSLQTKLQPELDQLNQYRAQVMHSLSEHGHMVEELGKHVQHHQTVINLLQEENVKIEAIVKEGKEVQRGLEDAQHQLDQVTTASQAIDTAISMDSNIARVEIWLKHSTNEIPNAAALNTSYKVLDTTKIALEMVAEDTETSPVELLSGHSHCTIMEAAKNAEGRPIKLVDLSTKEMRKKIYAGQVFAVLKNKYGNCQSSKLTFTNGTVYLHSLQKCKPPRGVSTLEVSKTVDNLGCFSTPLFMDLSWYSSESAYAKSGPKDSKERFHILLETRNPFAKEFMDLFLGHNGYTLCNTTMSEVENIFKSNCMILWGRIQSGGTTYKSYNQSHSIYSTSGINPHQTEIRFSDQGSETFTPIRGMLVVRGDKARVANITDFGIVICNTSNFRIQAHSLTNMTTVYCIGHVQTAFLQRLESTVFSNSSRYPRTTVFVDDCGVALPQ